MHPLLHDEYEMSGKSMSEETIVGLAILGVLINLGLIVATVMLMPDVQNSCQVQQDCKSNESQPVKYH